MAFESLESAQSVDDESPGSGRLSQSGQLIGWAVYGSLMVVAFMFGIVTGYDQPKTITIAKLPKEKDNPKAESQKADTPKPNVKPSAEPNPPAQPIVTAPIVTAPKNTPAAPVVNNSPKVEPKPTQPAVTTPPKPPTTIAAVPPKVETPPKKEDLKPVSFKTDVIRVSVTFVAERLF
jgi:hypothetical protein